MLRITRQHRTAREEHSACMGSLERTAAAVYFTCGRASRVRRRGRSTAFRYLAQMPSQPPTLSYASPPPERLTRWILWLLVTDCILLVAAVGTGVGADVYDRL